MTSDARDNMVASLTPFTQGRANMSDAQEPVPEIAPTSNGPCRVTNLKTLEGFYGAATHQTPEAAILCQCGGSKNKPFCDGSDRTNSFSDANAPDRIADKRNGYGAESITIHNNRAICAHTSRCTDSLEEVFRLKQEPWIHTNAASAAQIAAVIETCHRARSAIRSVTSNIATAEGSGCRLRPEWTVRRAWRWCHAQGHRTGRGRVFQALRAVPVRSEHEQAVL